MVGTGYRKEEWGPFPSTLGFSQHSTGKVYEMVVSN